jgi:hypothetical protein
VIGVISDKSETGVVREFFELFKTAWEFAQHGRRYDAVLATADIDEELDAPVVLLFGSGRKKPDDLYGVRLNDWQPSATVRWQDRSFPVLNGCSTLEGPGRTVLEIEGACQPVGLHLRRHRRMLFRFGFDLFREIESLLRAGQPAGHALTPTLDIHIELIRTAILSAGVPLAEIPPLPAPHRFIACLTHDVDFVGIRRHRFDSTMFGFIYRALLGSVSRAMRGELSWRKMAENWKAVASLPGIHMGILKDFMVQFDRYAEIEGGLPSTFFLIPHKNRAGLELSGLSSRGRAVKYDLTELPDEIRTLLARGCEIGLHGIDAWHSPERGDEERRRVSQITGSPDIGVRMHWLFFTKDTPRVLEQAGFSYDSTFGYNEAVGYRAGTSQVFRPPGTGLPELPLLIMDTALFSAGRMGLTQSEAFERVKRICSHASEHGGAVTVNWHHRSVGPERFWDDFYIRMLEEMKSSGAWFTTAREAVSWFEKRRSVVFRNVEANGSGLTVKLDCPADRGGPGVVLRVHHPPPMRDRSDARGTSGWREDIRLYGNVDTIIPLHSRTGRPEQTRK